MKVANKYDVFEKVNWVASNICTLAISKRKKILFGSGNGADCKDVFIIDLQTHTVQGNIFIVKLK
jgi:hypothetical protein